MDTAIYRGVVHYYDMKESYVLSDSMRATADGAIRFAFESLAQ